jgi:periplasmic protein CpxP/Spy
MIRTLTLAAVVAAGFSLPTFAADAPAAAAAPEANVTAAQSAELTTAANADQARKLLLAQGYTNVSDLNRDNQGRWTGTATKDGKTNFVAIALPEKAPAEKATN